MQLNHNRIEMVTVTEKKKQDPGVSNLLYIN